VTAYPSIMALPAALSKPIRSAFDSDCTTSYNSPPQHRSARVGDTHMSRSHEDAIQFIRDHDRARLQGQVDNGGDHAALEIATLIRLTAGLYAAVGVRHFGQTEVSAARGRLMLRLLADDLDGPGGGLTPTYLSRFSHVSPNTISSLLRGLEEQGMIERQLDPKDHRLFRIRLSHSGRRLIKSHAPDHIAQLNELASDLSPEERDQLATLLEKLYRSIVAHSKANPPTACDPTGER
jgi:DNA-binding MarR family transcriptional regulator